VKQIEAIALGGSRIEQGQKAKGGCKDQAEQEECEDQEEEELCEDEEGAEEEDVPELEDEECAEEEDGEEEEAEETREHDGAKRRAEQPKSAEARWPLPQQAAMMRKQANGTAAKLDGSSNGHGSGQRDSKETKELRREMRRLEEENGMLRMEIGQERYKVQQLTKLREQAALAHRKELQARKDQANAVRELNEARDYVDRRNEFSKHEKAELLQQIRSLETLTQEVVDRECGLKLQLQDALADRTTCNERVDEAKTEAARWQKTAVETAAKLKRADTRLQQLEQKRLDDKARIKALAEELRSALDAAAAVPASPGSAGPVLPSPSKARTERKCAPSPPPAPAKGAELTKVGKPAMRSSSRQPSQGASRRRGTTTTAAAEASDCGSSCGAGASKSTVAGKSVATMDADEEALLAAAGSPLGNALAFLSGAGASARSLWIRLSGGGDAAVARGGRGKKGGGRSAKGVGKATPAAEEADAEAAAAASRQQQQVLGVLVAFILCMAVGKIFYA